MFHTISIVAILIGSPMLCILLSHPTLEIPDKWLYHSDINWGRVDSVVKLMGVWLGLACLGFLLPGKTVYGPTTSKGHTPKYTDNGWLHCILSFVIYIGGSYMDLWDLSLLYDLHYETVVFLNAFAMVFCVFLVFKAYNFPSTADVLRHGNIMTDYYKGVELYPRLLGIDIKALVNCRFSMSYWQLFSFSAMMAKPDNLALRWCAISQILYLAKFFYWEAGYLTSTIDIVVDRAGFYETWGCFVWVPVIYTHHTRMTSLGKSSWSDSSITALGIISILSMLLNYWTDYQKQVFREKDGKVNLWGKPAEIIHCTYEVCDANRKKRTKKSILLASGWWGIARHPQYSWELITAWIWGIFAVSCGYLTGIIYPAFLTILLFHRAIRDQDKCLKKYGEDYKRYMKQVPYKIIPYIY